MLSLADTNGPPRSLEPEISRFLDRPNKMMLMGYKSPKHMKRHTCLATVLYTETSTDDRPIEQPKTIYAQKGLLSHISYRHF